MKRLRAASLLLPLLQPLLQLLLQLLLLLPGSASNAVVTGWEMNLHEENGVTDWPSTLEWEMKERSDGDDGEVWSPVTEDGYGWQPREISDFNIAEVTPSSLWRRQPLPLATRNRRSPQEETPRRRKGRRRKKGRRRGQKKRRRERTTTTESTIPPTQAPTYATNAPPYPRATMAVPHAAVPTRRSRVTAPPTRPAVPNYNVVPAGTINNRPVIGVLSQALPSYLNSLIPDEDFSSYIAASYVKFLETAGARVVPVMIGQTDHYYREMFRYLNGMLLPGGEVDLEDSGYATAVRTIWKVSAKHSLDYFPILGIGEGMQMIARVEGYTSFVQCSAMNLPGQLQLEPEAHTSTLLGGGGGSDEARRIFAATNATINFHRHCLRRGALRGGKLGGNYRALATGSDSNGRQFVAVIEHARLPIFGLQFHPEKVMYEWSRSDEMNNTPHSGEAILAAQHLANAFVAQARKNRHRFPSPQLEEDYLIYNYEPEFTGVMGGPYTTCYFFS